jgi:hypothetical protein
MIGEAYRRFLWHRATIKRNTTAVADSGATTYHYADLYTNVPCNVQNGGGRLKVDEFGNTTGKKLNVIFAREWSSKLQHNDLLVVNGESYRVTHGHDSWYYGQHHVEVQVEVYVPSGGLGTAG